MAEVGKLYLVSTPIGNLQDISKRALSVLTEVDEVVCEELRVGSTLMKRLGIDTPITLLNEHNETGQTTILLKQLLQEKISIVQVDQFKPFKKILFLSEMLRLLTFMHHKIGLFLKKSELKRLLKLWEPLQQVIDMLDQVDLIK